MAEPAAAAATRQVDDERVRVTEWRFPPGAHTGWHRHEYDYVVVPVTDGELRIVDALGEHRAELKLGQAYARRAGLPPKNKLLLSVKLSYRNSSYGMR